MNLIIQDYNGVEIGRCYVPDGKLLEESRAGTYRMTQDALFTVSFAIAKAATDAGIRPGKEEDERKHFDARGFLHDVNARKRDE